MKISWTGPKRDMNGVKLHVEHSRSYKSEAQAIGAAQKIIADGEVDTGVVEIYDGSRTGLIDANGVEWTR